MQSNNFRGRIFVVLEIVVLLKSGTFSVFFRYKTLMLTRCARFLCLFALWIPLSGEAQNADADISVEKPLMHLVVDTWNADDGLPTSNINQLHVDQTGFLWLASYDGLIRFDGAQFTQYSTKTNPKFETNSFTEIHEDTLSGTLWFGTEGSGLIGYKDGLFIPFGLDEEDFRYRVQSIAPRPDGKLWIGTRGHGLYVFDSTSKPHFTHVPGLEKMTVSAIKRDIDGTFWFGTTKGLFRRVENEFVQRDIQYGLPSYRIGDIFLDSEGELWVGTQSGVAVWHREENRFEVMESLRGEGVNRIFEDRAGSLWFGTGSFLARRKAASQKLEYFRTEDGLPHRIVKDIDLDREGSLWIGTYRGGLCRLKAGKFTNYTTKTGLGGTAVDCITRYDEDSYLVGTDDGLISFIQNDTIAPSPLHDVQLSQVRIKSLLRDFNGDIWIGTSLGIIKVGLPDHETQFFNESDRLSDNAVRQIIQTKDSMIWIGTRNGGITRMGADSESLFYFNKSTGFPSNFIMGMDEQPDGSILVATNDIGLVHVKGEEVIAHYTTKDGLPSNLIFNTYTDANGTVWIATNAGLSRFQDGTFYNYTTKDGLVEDALFDILEDNLGKLWFPTSRGVFFVKKQDFYDRSSGKIDKVSATMYDENDGMAEEQCTGATQSLKSRDGKLWFPTLNGITMIDPADIRTNELPPPVRITELTVDKKRFVPQSASDLSFPSDSRRFILKYTALSLLAPEKVTFQYKLEGLDDDWVDAGTKRQTTYTSLPYGKYTFRVKARNNDGVWNEAGAAVSFEVKPYLYQRPGFYALLVLVAILLVILFFRWRTQLIKRRAERLEELVQERTTELSQQTDRLARSYDRMRIVSEVGQEIVGAGLDIERILQGVRESISGIMDTSVLAIGLHRENDRQLQFISLEKDGESLQKGHDDLSNERLVSVRCFKAKSSVLIEDYPRYIEENDLISYRDKALPTVYSALYTPLRLQDKVIGVITVQSFEREAYSERQLRTLEALGTYVSVALDNSKVYEIIKNTNTRLTDSLRYALTIQQAILPAEERLSEAFAEHFVIFRPKDIVSGDFYWFDRVENKTFIAVVDCTGHGVPGAFMSMIGYTLLNEIVRVQGILEPDRILERMDEEIRVALRQEEGKNVDGMELGLCVLTKNGEETLLEFAGAKSPMYLVQDGKLTKVRGTRRAIGGGKRQSSRAFVCESFKLGSGDVFYLSSDGYPDQSSPQRQKLGSLRFIELLETHHDEMMAKQRIILEGALDEHQEDEAQRDDITVAGVRI